MKQTVTIITFLFCLNYSFSQSVNQLVIDDKGKEKLLGKINREGLQQNSFKNWFDKNYETYITNNKAIKTIKKDLNEYTIKVFLGTWCGDSKREVPRFYKLLDQANFPEDQLEVIALDRTQEAYKQSPTGEEKDMNIHRVPTFVFYKDGKEVNRIVESPKETFERDIANIIKGKYRSNYQAANYLDMMIKQYGVKALKNMEDDLLVSRLSEMVKGSRELNTLGYVNLRAGNTEKALYIFGLNTKIFPYRANVYDSLGEAYFDAKNYKAALGHYYKVLTIDSEDKNAPLMIEKIREAMN